MRNQLTEKVSFDFIRYANCWEDADILLEGLNIEKGSKILSIGSAGDNSFSLLTTDPELVVAVDVNKIQLHLIELKKVCIQQLEHRELIEFLGFGPSQNRIQTFQRLKKDLSDGTRLYWEINSKQINAGIISQGKFENYFQLFSSKLLPWIHSQKIIEKLFEKKSAVEQVQFYQKQWNTWRWRFLFRFFFSRYIMGRYGRDPEFLKEVKVPVSESIFKRAEQHLKSTDAQGNFMLRYQLTGDFVGLLPHYLQPENLKKIKANIDKLRIVEGYAEDAINSYGKFKYMNLSNIFEYMNPELFLKTATQLTGAMENGGRLAYWNLMVPRRISAILDNQVQYQRELSARLTGKDKGFFYNAFIIDQVK